MQSPRFQLDDTIGAVASAPGAAIRGIIRLSGPGALVAALGDFVARDAGLVTDSRSAHVRQGMLTVPGFGDVPAALYAWPGTRSYTRQPMVELHLPGSPPLLDAVLARLFSSGVRPAVPGEFTLRAFLSGRIDLVQAEAVLGVIDAPGTAELSLALRQLAGGISTPMVSLRNDLLDLLADLEAGLDFTDEGIEFVSREEVRARLARHVDTLAGIVDQADRRSLAEGRSRVLLAGLPNAGKSTLFNALLRRDSAIVSTLAGTTRDYLRGETIWAGLSIELIDTPGVDNADGIVERQAQILAADCVQHADLVLWCRTSELDGGDLGADRRARSRLPAEATIIDVTTKIDLCDDAFSSDDALRVSAVDGRGLTALQDRCIAALSSQASGSITAATAARCRGSLSSARDALQAAHVACGSSSGDELIAIELRLALDYLGHVLGSLSTDDLLDRIFSRFCIGK